MSEPNKVKKIYEINAMNIPHSEKARMISQIMNPSKITKNISTKIYCSHYKKHNNQVSKCCNKVYPCRLCHDENENHIMDRHDIDYMKCDYCHSFQKVNSSCQNPECYKFYVKQDYFCRICNLWSDNKSFDKVIINSILVADIDTRVEVYHCSDCGICRLGKAEDYKHCHTCNLCIKKNIFETHPCKINIKEQNCPICLKDIWSAVNDSPYILKCGHSMHTSCFYQSIQSQNFFCSLCKKSMIDLSSHWRIVDDTIVTHQMPEEFQDWTSEIHCNECEKKSNAKYHFAYHKCQHCQGYNTVIDKVNKIEQQGK
jgi:hypothetical protein